MEVGKAISGARRRARLTQAELAERAATSQPTLSAYESGRKSPSVPVLARLLEVAGARLSAEPDLDRNARALNDVLLLAGMLPSRHEPELSYPRLPVER